MVDPTDLTALTEVEFQSGHATKPVILSASHFELAQAFFQTHGYGDVTLKVDAEKEAARHVRVENTLDLDARGAPLLEGAGPAPVPRGRSRRSVSTTRSAG